MNALPFEVPGPGCWQLDATHFAKPISVYLQSVFADAYIRGFRSGAERYGLTTSYMQPAFVNGFVYTQAVPAGLDGTVGAPRLDTPEMQAYFENGLNAIESKLWREELRHWDEDLKPDSVRRNRGLQGEDPGTLDDASLCDHLHRCHENLRLMFYRHHVLDMAALLPIGLFLGYSCEWTGLPHGELLAALRGTTPVSRGVARTAMSQVAAALEVAGIKAEDLAVTTASDAGLKLDELRARADDVARHLECYLDAAGYIITGYDVTECYPLEQPLVLLANITGAMNGPSSVGGVDATSAAAKIRQSVPPRHQASFDTWLEEARHLYRLRDERGLYNDLWALGLSRRAILEAGRRLAERGQLSAPGLLIHAGHESTVAALRGDALDESLLKNRSDWFSRMSASDVPDYLGDPPQPLTPLEELPEAARPAAMAINAAFGNIFDQPGSRDDKQTEVRGLPVSPGVYTGTARVVDGSAEFGRIRKGDVLVTRYTSASFNVLLPLLGAIVTDRGGQLSHAAIVAREYGLPAVVSTRSASRQISDGAEITVDGSLGLVTVNS